jgi:amidase
MAHAVLAGADTLASLGAKIVEITMPPMDQAAADGFNICAVEVAMVHEDTYPARADEYGPALKGLIDTGRAATTMELTKMIVRRAEFKGAMDALLEKVDLVLLPAYDRANITNLERASVVADPQQRANRVRFTAPLNVCGLPSLTLPGGKTATGLPFGFQIVGKAFGEAEVLRAGHAFQEATDWHLARPERIESL